MRRQAEHCLELPNEMEGRDLHGARELAVEASQRLLATGATEAAESFVPEEHAQ